MSFRIGHFKTKSIVDQPKRRAETLFTEKYMAAMFIR